MPIFINNDELWGIISSPLKLDSLLQLSKTDSSEQNINLAIRYYDKITSQTVTIFGDDSIFKQKLNVQTTIKAGGTSWNIGAVSTNKNPTTPSDIFALRIYLFFAMLIFSVFVWYRFNQESDKKSLELKMNDEKLLLESVGNVAKIGGWKLDKSLNFIQWSEQSSLLLGMERNYFPNNINDLKPFFSKEDFSYLKDKSTDVFQNSKEFDIELQRISVNRPNLWVRIMSNGVKVDSNSCTISTIQDITDKILNARLIEHQASYDSLTGLPNRLLYQDRLVKSIENAHRNKQKMAILFIDLDRFKPINDNHGHHAGDKLLIEAAFRIKKAIRESDTVSRLSGDEFAVILNNTAQYNHVLKVAENILTDMQRPYDLQDASVHLSASIGIAFYPDDADNADSLLRKADQAMYEVKRSGRNGCQFYTKEMQLKSEYRHELLNELIVAVSKGHLIPFYQPIVDLKSDKIIKLETLARWPKENGVSVPADDFINLAEESGLINKIDLFMLKESGKYLKDLDRNIELSINISPRLFHTKDNALQKWTHYIKELSKSVNITVEITERLLTENSESTLNILNNLKSYGIKIAIDDFGTGYSSLNYLMKYPVDIIKIDRVFIKEIGIDPSSEALIETILAMAKRLNIQVIAEGIESTLQLDYLKKNHCEFGQGYLFGKPMDQINFSKLINQAVTS